jgi:hypothetical protein
MSTPDDTYYALIRTPFNDVVKLIFAADHGGSYTFNCMNPEKKWRVRQSYEYIVVDEGWTVTDFNDALDNYYKNR